jgi:hypothetical protein
VTDFEHKEAGPSISNYDELVFATIKSRMNAVYDEMARNMNISMYGDREPPHKLTRRERLVRRFHIYRSRISDAWAVLTGRAEIGDGW